MLPPSFEQAMAQRPAPPVWINLEYLSSEDYVERSHGLASPQLSGPGVGLTKWFFYPGFTPRTGGLLREHDLPQRRAGFRRADWLRQWGVTPGTGQVLSLFCYEPPALAALLQELALGEPATDLLVTAGRAAAAVNAALAQLAMAQPGWNGRGQLRLHWLPLLSQREYDHLLWSCDLNFVRGEDSIVRGLLAGVPCIWQLYPQDDAVLQAKLEAFLGWLQPPTGQAQWLRAWNTGEAQPLPALEPAAWGASARAAAARIAALPELAAGLQQAAAGRSRI
jgi:uncharacterized repeat protein (TIGR03837 family)